VVECGEIERPEDDTDGHPGQSVYSQILDDHVDYYQLWNEVIALGLICGASRVATVFVDHPLYIYGGDWHQEVAHEAWVSEVAAGRMAAGNQTFFEHVFCDLCQRLDVPDCDGQSVLHHSLVMWNHESGQLTHDNFSTPTIVAGSAGGALSAGQYCDYRDRTDTSLVGTDSALHQEIRPGLLYAQWLATALRVCDVDEADWVTPGNPGYGVWYTERPQGVAGYVQGMANDVLPFLAP
jgi:hypothetical protein